MEMARSTQTRPKVSGHRRAMREVHMEPKAMIAEKRGLRTWAPYICTAVGWALTALLGALMAAGVEVWVVFEVGFAAAVLFGVGIGWKIAEEVGRRG